MAARRRAATLKARGANMLRLVSRRGTFLTVSRLHVNTVARARRVHDPSSFTGAFLQYIAPAFASGSAIPVRLARPHLRPLPASVGTGTRSSSPGGAGAGTERAKSGPHSRGSWQAARSPIALIGWWTFESNSTWQHRSRARGARYPKTPGTGFTIAIFARVAGLHAADRQTAQLLPRCPWRGRPLAGAWPAAPLLLLPEDLGWAPAGSSICAIRTWSSARRAGANAGPLVRLRPTARSDRQRGYRAIIRQDFGRSPEVEAQLFISRETAMQHGRAHS